MTEPKVAQCIQVVSTLLHEEKPVLELFCLHFNTIGRSGHVASTIREETIGWGFSHVTSTIHKNIIGQLVGEFMVRV